jgi:hypothetical protein
MKKIWQEALDGLLSLAPPEALAVSPQPEHVTESIDRRANDSSPAQGKRLNIFAKLSLANLLVVPFILDLRNTCGLRLVP